METSTPNTGNLGTAGSTGKVSPAQAAERAHSTVDRVAQGAHETVDRLAAKRHRCLTARGPPRAMRRTRFMPSTTISLRWKKSGRSRPAIKSVRTLGSRRHCSPRGVADWAFVTLVASVDADLI